jgi:hypothetical protein
MIDRWSSSPLHSMLQAGVTAADEESARDWVLAGGLATQR